MWRILTQLDLRNREPDAVAAAHENLAMFFDDTTQLFKVWLENTPDPSPDDLEQCEPSQILSRCVHQGREIVENIAFTGQNTLG